MNNVIHEGDAMAVYIMFTAEIGVITSVEINGNTMSPRVSLETGSLRPDDSRHFIVSRYMFNW